MIDCTITTVPNSTIFKRRTDHIQSHWSLRIILRCPHMAFPGESWNKLNTAQNTDLKTATGCHVMSDRIIYTGKQHSEMLAQPTQLPWTFMQWPGTKLPGTKRSIQKSLVAAFRELFLPWDQLLVKQPKRQTWNMCIAKRSQKQLQNIRETSS